MLHNKFIAFGGPLQNFNKGTAFQSFQSAGLAGVSSEVQLGDGWLVYSVLLLVWCKLKLIMSIGRIFTSPKNTPYPKGLGLDSPRVPSSAAVLVGCGLLAVGCWLAVVAVVAAVAAVAAAAAFGGASGRAAGNSFFFWRWGYKMVLLSGGRAAHLRPRKGRRDCRRLINM